MWYSIITRVVCSVDNYQVLSLFCAHRTLGCCVR
uniref:Uncharacterized protein n=1 Tax=Anopheles arabiensis TaxID=7173 RepID=A0A182IFK3_ANOAR